MKYFTRVDTVFFFHFTRFEDITRDFQNVKCF